MRSTLATQVKELAQTYVHGGRFTTADVARWGKQAPCAIVAALNVRNSTLEGDVHTVNVQWGCFLLVTDRPNAPRDVLALTLIELLLGVIRPDQRWGDAQAHLPTEIRADNLYEPKLDASGAGLWAISWLQAYDVNAFDTSALDDFLRYRNTWGIDADLDDTPQAEDAVDLEGPS